MLVFLFALSLATTAFAQCILDLNLPYSPLIFNGNSDFPTDSYDNSTVVFGVGETFYLKCPRGTSSALLSDDGEEVLCVGGTGVYVIRTEQTVSTTQVVCATDTPPHAVRILHGQCANGYTEIEVGIEIGGRFSWIYSVCFDENQIIPFYVEYQKGSSCAIGCPNVAYPYVDSANFYSTNLDTILLNGRNILDDQGLGEEVSLSYFRLIQDEYFFDPVRKESTYDFINVAFGLEADGTYASQVCVDHLPIGSDVFLGTLGVALYPTAVGELVEVYAGDDGRMPVPKWHWCIYYDVSPEVDGKFFLAFSMPVNTTLISLTSLVQWWIEDVCANADDTVLGIPYFQGNCSFTQVISPELQNFVRSKWPTFT